MKSLTTLLKVAQRRLDELGVEAQRIQQHVDELGMQLSGMLGREEVEVENARHDVMFASMLPAYRARVKVQADAIRVRIAETEATLALVRERLSLAYQEKSKFEQLIEQDRIREALERAAVEQKSLDEVAINRAGRIG
jgi:flagellar export protein FliJ